MTLHPAQLSVRPHGHPTAEPGAAGPARPRRRGEEAHLAASSTAAVLGIALLLSSDPSWLAIAGGLLTVQATWWFCFALGGALRKGWVSRRIAAVLVAPAVVGGALALDTGLVDHIPRLACAGASVVVGGVILYGSVRRRDHRPDAHPVEKHPAHP